MNGHTKNSPDNSPGTNQEVIGWKIGLGFVLVLSLFLFIIWRHQVILDLAFGEYQQLREQVQLRKDTAFTLQKQALTARNAELLFLTNQDWQKVKQVTTQIEQIQSSANNLDLGQDNRDSQQTIQLVTLYLDHFHAIAQAWKEKGLDHNSGLQGRFRDSAHKMEEMAKALVDHQPMVGIRLEKDILTLRRREKDYLLRGDKKYVHTFEEEINSLNHYLSQLTLDQGQTDQFKHLLMNYQEDFLALVDKKEQIDLLTAAMNHTASQIVPFLDQVSDQAEQAVVQTMQKLIQQANEHRRDMLLTTLFAALMAGLIALVVAKRISAQHRQLIRGVSRYQAIMNNAVDGIVTIDQRGIIESVNPALENIFGYNTGELVGENVSILTPSPHREVHDEYLNNYLRTGKKKIIGSIREVEGICRDGGKFPLELSVSAYQSEGQTYFTGILHDITDRKQAKDALEKAYDELEFRVQERTRDLSEVTEKLQQEVWEHEKAEAGLRLAAKVFENASEAIVVTNAKSVIIEVNEAFTAISGFSREEAIGGNPSIGKSGRHKADFYAEMWKTILSKGMWRGEIWDRRKNGEIYPKWLTINVVRDDQGEIANFVGIFTDISHVKATEKRLEQLAFYDALTTLPNRLLFRDRLEHEFKDAHRHKQKVGVFFIDLDRFKHVNDTLGHAAGDLLLIEVAKRITECIRKSDTVARLGGDEFTVILTEVEKPQQVAQVAANIIAAMQRVFQLDEHEAYIGASIGIALFPEDGDNFDTLTKNADVAMYQAKESGRGVYRFFKPEMDSNTSGRLSMEVNLRNALEREQFQLYYQPKLDLLTGEVRGMEALVRWQFEGKMISPIQFIPLAEETGLIEPLGEWIMQTACQQTKIWQEANLPPLKVAVNLSARQFNQANLIQSIADSLTRCNLSAEQLELEITESMVMQDADQAIKILSGLREMGLSIAVDDFGTGYSSLSYLKKFPLHILKIDQSFVRDLAQDSDDSAIVTAIISLAHSLGMNVVAEGVETAEQMAFLKEHGCGQVQGYLFCKPLPAETFAPFLREHQEKIAKAANNS
ncbi:MAG: EAL domain-containing protein [Magnetococcales bacterium]|nr:EAL domain-containing protein [Magnetococcales bacterium]